MAKMRCISKCQFKGDIVRVGDIVDIDEKTLANDPLAKSAFVQAEPSAGKPAVGKAIVAGLTREQAILKLTSMKVNVPSGATDDEIAKIFKSAVDAKAHSNTKPPEQKPPEEKPPEEKPPEEKPNNGKKKNGK